MNAHSGRILTIKELRQSASPIESTLQVDIEIKEGILYKTADNLKIYPENSERNVNIALKSIGLDGDTMLEFSGVSVLPFPSPIKARSLLKKFVDLQGTVKKSNIRNLAEGVKDPNVKKDLLSLADDKSRLVSIHEKMWGIVDLIENFNISLEVKDLLLACDRISVISL